MSGLVRKKDILNVLNKERKYMIERNMVGAEHILVHNALRLIEGIKEVIDVVEVVRCKDCTYSTQVDYREPMWECRNICRDGCTQWLDSEDFCSYGERRKE